MVRCVLPLLWIPGPRHYLLFSHISKSWIGMSCHSCGFQDLVITCYFSHVSKLWFAHLPSWSLGLFMCFFCHVIMPWVSSLYPRNDYQGCQLFLCVWTIAGLFFYLVATIQGLFFIHVATIVCRLFWSSSELAVSSALVPRHSWLASLAPFSGFVNFWFYLIVYGFLHPFC